jgi:hypothetical protein
LARVDQHVLVLKFILILWQHWWQHFADFAGPQLERRRRAATARPPLAARKELTFEQAEGAEQLPQQLKLRELSPVFRACIWNIVYSSIEDSTDFRPIDGGGPGVEGRWRQILGGRHIYSLARPVDEFSAAWRDVCAELKPLIMAGSYVQIFKFWDFFNW